MMKYELIPTNGRKSFYHKAMVMENDDGSKVLFSYETPIMKENTDGSYIRFYDNNPSKTTCSHIISFSSLHKQEFLKLPLEVFNE